MFVEVIYIRHVPPLCVPVTENSSFSSRVVTSGCRTKMSAHHPGSLLLNDSLLCNNQMSLSTCSGLVGKGANHVS